jgi:hAT family C-terminal dimerisation region
MFSTTPIMTVGTDVDIYKTYGHLITLKDDEELQFQCNICVKLASFLSSSNPDEANAIVSLTKFRSCSNSAHIVAHLAYSHPEHLLPAHANLPTYKNPAKINLLSKNSKDTLRSPISESIDMMFRTAPIDKLDLTLWLLEDMRPFSVVEDTGFKKFIESINKGLKSKIKLPSADTIAREATLANEALQQMLRMDIAANVAVSNDEPFSQISYTIGAWTSIAGKPFLGVTMHYITRDFEMKSHALALRDFPPPHTANNYIQLFSAIIDEYGLGRDTTLFVTTDSASVMINMMEKFNIPHMRCLSHCINLAVQADTFDKPKFKELIGDPIKLNGYFPSTATTRNHIAQEKANALKKAGTFNDEFVKPVQLVVTSCNSICNMLRSHLRRFPVIASIAGAELDLEPVKRGKFDALVSYAKTLTRTHQAILTMLEPISIWTAILQSSTVPTISLVFEARADILKNLQPDPADPVKAGECRAHLKKVIEKRLNEDVVPIKFPAEASGIMMSAPLERARTHWQMINCAALLDVRTAYQHFNSDHLKDQNNLDTIIAFIVRSILLWKSPTKDGDINSSKSGWIEKRFTHKTRNLHNELEIVISKELTSYLQVVETMTTIPQPDSPDLPPIDKPLEERLKLNPLDFWKRYKSEFPHLASVARSLLAAQATSAPSERLFSNARFIGNRHRSRLTTDSLESCALLRDALKQDIDVKKLVNDIWQKKRESTNRKRSETRFQRMEGDPSDKKARFGDESTPPTRDDDIDLTDDDDEPEVETRETSEEVTKRQLKIAQLLFDNVESDEDEISVDPFLEAAKMPRSVAQSTDVRRGAKLILLEDDTYGQPIDE